MEDITFNPKNVRGDWKKLFTGEVQAIEIPVIISLEITPNGSKLVHQSCRYINDNAEIFEFWNRPVGKGKTTGGKKSYSMLMKDAFIKLIAEHSPSNEEIGVMTKLFLYADWGTGLLVKRKKPLKFANMVEIIGNSEPTVKKIIKSLKDKFILDYRDNGYYLSRTFIRKGAK